MPTKNHVKINQTITGETQVFGIIGQPVKFSLSPMIHNTISDFLGHNNAYVAFPVESGGLEAAVKGGHAQSIKGFNVTHPYKQDVIPMLTYVDPLALKIGAVNTLQYEKDGYRGYNTDADGLYESLQQNNVSLKDKDVVVLGAGGAARAVCMMAAHYGARSIYILNRTVNNAESLAIEVRKHYNIETRSLALDDWALVPEASICFQTTSVGMGETESLAPIENDDFYKKLSIAVDLIYNPSKTHFLKNSQKQGCYIINGFGMLFFQAIKAYELWNDMIFTDSQLELLLAKIEGAYRQISE